MSEHPEEILDGVWRFSAVHPDWTEAEGGEEGWDPAVAWWAVQTAGGLLLVDPLVDDWASLDEFVAAHGGCAAIVRTLHWHARDGAAAAARYAVPTWAASAAGCRWEGDPVPAPDRTLGDRDELADGILSILVHRDDELALWLPAQAALMFADVMLRRPGGELRVCPDSWTQPPGGHEQLVRDLRELSTLPVEHVLVSHGPPVTGDGARSLAAALG